MINGFLAQMGTPGQRQTALRERSTLLDQDPSLVDEGALAQAQAHLQLASLARQASNFDQASGELETGLKILLAYGEKNGYLGVAFFRTVDNSLIFLTEHRKYYERLMPLTRSLFDKTQEAISKQKEPGPVLEKERQRMQSLVAALRGAQD